MRIIGITFLMGIGSGLFSSHSQAQLPAYYDLRAIGQVSPVKDQGSCGSCWAFASIAAIESSWLKSGYGMSDLSEDNLTDCHQFDEQACMGGSFYMASALLSRHNGPLTETSDPYTPATSNCPLSQPFPPQPCAFAEDIRWLPKDNNVIKQALMNIGAVATSMFFNMANYNVTSYKYYDPVISSADSVYPHSVTIVGWNDTLHFAGAPGQGGWIIKDSYGTTWAQSGYFYVSFNDAGILSENAVFPQRYDIPPPSNKTNIYYYDTYGWVDSKGFGNSTAYGLAKYVLTPTSGIIANQQIKRIGTYTVTNNTWIHVELYRFKTGNVLSGLIDSANAYCEFKGFYTIPLMLPTDTIGSEIYIKVKYQCPPGTILPIPVEIFEANHTSGISLAANSCWMSQNGASWNLTGQGTSFPYDLCIKLYTEDAPRAVIGQLPDTVCRGMMLMLTDNTPFPKDSIRWLINGSYYGQFPSFPFLALNPGMTTISLIAYLGHNTDTTTRQVFVFAPDTSVFLVGSVLSSGALNSNYQWLDCDNNYYPVMNQNGQSFAPTVSGLYAVQVIQHGCADTSYCHPVTIMEVEESPAFDRSLWIYPDPFRSILNFELPNAMNIVILDIRGKIVYRNEHAAGTSVAELERLSGGIYIIQFVDRENTHIRKIVKTY